MKTFFLVLVVLAVAAFVQSSPLPQTEESAPNRPIMNAISAAAETANQTFGSLASSGMSAAKRIAETTGYFIDNTAQTMTMGINTVAHTLSGGINRPFQSAAEPTLAWTPIDWINGLIDKHFYHINDSFLFIF